MKSSSARFTFAAVSLFSAILLTGCGNSRSLRSLTIVPASSSIDAGTTQQFVATGKYGDGTTADLTASASWSSSNPSVATITSGASGGVATAVAPGTATITASMSGVSTTATLTVNRKLLSIALTPNPASVALGATLQFTATGTFQTSGGTTTQDVTTLVTWTSSSTAVATISTAGLATSITSGSTTITATLSGVSGQESLTVGPPAAVSLVVTPSGPTIAIGNTVTLSAQEHFSDGTTHPLTGTVTWAAGSCTPAGSVVAAVTAQNGSAVAAGLLAGSCTVSATEGKLTGTAAVTVVTGSTHFAYVSNTNGPSISEFSVNASSSTPFTALGTVLATAPVQTMVHPSGLYVYSMDAANNIHLYDVNASTGALTLRTGDPQVSAGAATGATNGIVDPTGRFLYVVDSVGATAGTIEGFSINLTNGTLTSLGAAVTINVSTPQGVAVDRSGRFLYVINNGNNTVSEYAIDPVAGTLTPLPTPTIATGPSPFLPTIDPSNHFLYVPNSTDSTVSAFAIGTGGALSALGSPTPITGATPPSFLFNVAVDPSGKFLYVLDTPLGTGHLYGFNIGAGGAIGTPLAGSPYATDSSPTGIAIDPTGKLVAVDNNFSNDLSPFAAAANGVLTPDALVPTGNAPLFVTFYNAP
ncbi:MAG TPA: beta-propeller fold lactonase family protein [Candidatus Acidoferrum sp.]